MQDWKYARGDRRSGLSGKTTANRRKPRASEAGKRGRWMGKGNRFLPDEREARSTESAAYFAEMGCRGKSTRIFPRPGFFWFVFLPAKKMNTSL